MRFPTVMPGWGINLTPGNTGQECQCEPCIQARTVRKCTCTAQAICAVCRPVLKSARERQRERFVRPEQGVTLPCRICGVPVELHIMKRHRLRRALTEGKVYCGDACRKQWSVRLANGRIARREDDSYGDH